MTLLKPFIRVNLYVFMCFAMSMSCSKKSDPAPVSCAVTKRVETTPDYVWTSDFTYDGDQKLIKIVKTFVTTNPSGVPTTTQTFTYSYSGSSVASLKVEYSGNSGSYLSTWTNQSGKLVKIDVSGGSASETITFSYDTQGRFKSSSFTSPGATGGTQASYDTGGAPVTMSTNVSVPQISLTETDNFTVTSVDAHQNPYALLAKAINQPNFYDGFEGNLFVEFLTVGNPLKVTRVSTTNNSTGTNNWTYVYEYNTKGYPTKVTGTIAGISYQTVTTFEYSNCN